MKKFFRWLRGELNGNYLQSMNLSFNSSVEKERAALQRFNRMQFRPLTVYDEDGMSRSELLGLGIFTGVFLPYVSQDSLNGTIKFTDSHKVGGEQMSERGLWLMEDEGFMFVDNDIQSDINTYAAQSRRSSMIGEDDEPKGMIVEGVENFFDDGTYDESKVIPLSQEPPTDKAWSYYYGQKFLFLSEESPIRAKLSTEVYYNYIQAVRYIRYNSPSIDTLTNFIEKICNDFLFILSIDWQSNYGLVKYGVDDVVEVEDKLMKLSLFQLVITNYFPQLVPSLVQIEVTRDDEGNVIDIEEVV